MTFVILMALVAFAATSFAAEEKLFYEDREDIPEQYRWNLEIIFPDIDAWEAAYAEVEAQIPELAAYKGRLGESADVMFVATELINDISKTIEDIYVYAGQWQSTDTRNADANTYVGRARALNAKFGQATAFFEPEIVQLPDATIAKYLEDPRLETYDHVLDNILRTKAHTRSQEVEELLAGSALLQGSPQQTYGFLTSADIEWPSIKDENGEDKKVVPGLYYTFMSSQDRRVRKDAALALFGTYDEYGNTFSGTYNGLVQKDVWMAKTRNYPSTLDMELDQTNVPSSVVETLVSTVHDNLDAVHQYVELRKKVLGLEDFHIYDLYVSMVPEGRGELHLRRGLGDGDGVLDGDLRRGVRRGRRAGPQRALDRCLRERRQTGRRLLVGHLQLAPLSLPQLGRHPRRRLHPGPRDGPLHPHLPRQPEPALSRRRTTRSSSPRWLRWRRSRSSSSGCSNAPPTRPNGWPCSTSA